jgi:transposase
VNRGCDDTPVNPGRGDRAGEAAWLYLMGHTLAGVAGQLGVSSTLVRRWLDTQGVPRRRAVVAGRLSGEQLERLYVGQGLSVNAVAARLGVSPATVSRRLRELGIPLRPPRRRPSPRSAPAATEMPGTVELSLAAALRELYVRQGLAASEVAVRLGIPATRVRAQLRALGIPVRPGGAAGRVGRPGDPLPRVLLERLYVQQGLSVGQVAARLGVDRERVTRRLAAYGIRPHPHGWRGEHGLTHPVLQELYERQQLTLRAIAERFGVTHGTVRRALARHGIAPRPRTVPGSGGRPPLSAEALHELYVTRGQSMTQIARQLGYLTPRGAPAVARVRRALARAGIRRRQVWQGNLAGRQGVDHRLLEELYVDQQLSATQVGLLVGLSATSVLHRLHQQGVPVRAPGLPRRRRSQHSGRQARVLLRELYEDSQIRAVLQRHGVRLVDPDDWQPPGPNQAFTARPLDRILLAELYGDLGLSAWHIELLCGVSESNVLQQLHRHAIMVRTGEGFSPYTHATTVASDRELGGRQQIRLEAGATLGSDPFPERIQQRMG